MSPLSRISRVLVSSLLVALVTTSTVSAQERAVPSALRLAPELAVSLDTAPLMLITTGKLVTAQVAPPAGPSSPPRAPEQPSPLANADRLKARRLHALAIAGVGFMVGGALGMAMGGERECDGRTERITTPLIAGGAFVGLGLTFIIASGAAIPRSARGKREARPGLHVPLVLGLATIAFASTLAASLPELGFFCGSS